MKPDEHAPSPADRRAAAARRRAREQLLADREAALALRGRRRIGLRLPAKLPLLPPRRPARQG